MQRTSQSPELKAVYRLTAGQVAAYRANLLIQQGNKCALCGQALLPKEAVLDHDHKTGHIRGVLHRGCNTALGRIENNAPRDRLTVEGRLAAWAAGLAAYTQGSYTHLPLHHTYRTEAEKRALRNTRARKARATK